MEDIDVKFIVDFVKNGNKSSFSQNPEKWIKQNYPRLSSYIRGKSKEEIRLWMFEIVYGTPKCKNCGKNHSRMLPGWRRGWMKTCSNECRSILCSKRQMGSNNTYHRMSEEDKKRSRQKQSNTMKQKILSGEFTPKSENYRTHGFIKFTHGEEIRKVRSLWEMIYWINNPELLYESIRIPYYDTKVSKDRIYITDFYDSDKNTIIEIKPNKYWSELKDKKIGVVKSGYKYEIVGDEYFRKQKTIEMENLILDLCINQEECNLKSRLKWMKRHEDI